MSRTEQSRRGLSDLHAVVAVAQHKSFRRAARELGVSASALSHAVAGLEQQLGVRLFQRTTRSVSLTEAGQRFVERVRPALGEIADAMDQVNDFRDKPAGTLRINTAIAAVRRMFDPVIVPFLARYPDVQLDIVTDGRLVDIVAGGFDAGIRLAELVPRDMVAVPCSAPMRFVVVGSPEYLARHKKPKSPGDLAAHACIRRRMPSGAPLRWELQKGARSMVLDVHGPLTLDADELVVAAVLRGLGLGWVNEWSVEAHVAAGRLVTVLDEWSAPFPGLCLYYPPHRHASAALRAFVALIRESGVAGAKRAAGARNVSGKGYATPEAATTFQSSRADRGVGGPDGSAGGGRGREPSPETQPASTEAKSARSKERRGR